MRRIFEAVGRAVSRLIRIRYGAMTLPRGLRRGHWMELGARELAALAAAAGMSAAELNPAAASAAPRQRRNADRSSKAGPRPAQPSRRNAGRNAPGPLPPAMVGDPELPPVVWLVAVKATGILPCELAYLPKSRLW